MTSNIQWTKEETKGQTAINKTLHIKLTIEQHEHHQQSGGNSGTPEGLAASCSACYTHRVRVMTSQVIFS